MLHWPQLYVLLATGIVLSSPIYAQDATPAANQCISELCGNYSTDTVLARSPEQSARIDEDYKTVLAPMIRTQMLLAIEAEVLRREYFKLARAVVPDGVVIPDGLRAAFNLQYVVDAIEIDGFSDTMSLPDTGLILKEAEAKAILEKAGVADPQGVVWVIKELYKTKFHAVNKVAGYMKLSMFHQGYYSQISYDEMIKKHMSLIAIAQTLSSSVSRYAAVVTPAILRKYMNKEPITDDDSEDFFREVGSALILIPALSPSSDSRLHESLLALKRDYVKEFKLVIEEMPPPVADYQPLMAETAALCAAKYKQRLHTVPTRAGVDAFKNKNLPNALNGMVRVLKKFNLERFEPGLRALKWNFPLEYSVEVANMRDEIHSDLLTNDDFKKRQGELKAAILAGDPVAIATAVGSALIKSGDKHALMDIQRECDKGPKSNHDSLSVELNTVNVGWQMILGIEDAFTFGHEMGHYIYRQMKAGEATQLRCLAEKHFGLQDPSALLEEDYADMIGVQLELELRQPRDSRGFCLYRDLKKSSPSFSSLIQSGDVHSTHLFRLLSAAAEHGAVPQSCRQLVKESKANKILRRCGVK